MNAPLQFGVANPVSGLAPVFGTGAAVFLVAAVPSWFGWVPEGLVPMARPLAALMHASAAAMLVLLYKHWQLLQERLREYEAYRATVSEGAEQSWMHRAHVAREKWLGKRHTVEQDCAAVDRVFTQLNEELDDTWKCYYWSPICVFPLVALLAGFVHLGSNALLDDFSALFAPLWLGSLEFAAIGLGAWYLRRQWTHRLLQAWKTDAQPLRLQAAPSTTQVTPAFPPDGENMVSTNHGMPPRVVTGVKETEQSGIASEPAHEAGEAVLPPLDSTPSESKVVREPEDIFVEAVVSAEDGPLL